ncbi:helix-turn-helix transcriptional regulator [Emcibacter sp.]|uniref:response regulator transcription factor n=1 Tax=Emcibacter sp. TaxID=1979954 RepID=UPI002AA70BFC|nr:helix-turn-helix transcriptional regulator [Emcibacter sp.]
MNEELIASPQWYRHLAEIFGSRESEELLPALTAALKYLSGADSLLMMVYTENQPPVFLYKAADHGLRKRNVDEYLSGYYLLDPFFQLSSHYGETALVHLENISHEGFYDSEYYETWFKYAGLRDEVNYFVPVGNGRTVAISLSRNLDNRSFNQQDIHQLELVLPLIDAIVTDYWTKLEPTLAVGSQMKQTLHDNMIAAMNNFGRSVLTERESEITQYLLRGHSIKSTAERLKISPTTIKVHRKHIYQKLDISSHSELFSLFIDALSTMEPGEKEDPLSRYL